MNDDEPKPWDDDYAAPPRDDLWDEIEEDE